MGREVVVAVTNGRLDSGTWERILQGQADWLARESRWPSPEAGVGQDHRGVAVIRAILPLAVDWPGWWRSGREEKAALQALVDYGPR
jgi:hypothetical protein